MCLAECEKCVAGLQEGVSGPPQNSCQKAGLAQTRGASPEGRGRCESLSTLGKVGKCVTQLFATALSEIRGGRDGVKAG